MRRRSSPDARPYWVAGCTFEPQGLLEAWISARGRPGLVCDECRLVWLDPTDIAVESSYLPPAGTTDLPDGDTLDPPIARPATRADLEAAGWWPYVSQTSRAEHGDEILTLPEGTDADSLELHIGDRTAEIEFSYTDPSGEARARGALRFDWMQHAATTHVTPADPVEHRVRVYEQLDSDLRAQLSTASPAATRHFRLRAGSSVFDVVAATVELVLDPDHPTDGTSGG